MMNGNFEREELIAAPQQLAELCTRVAAGDTCKGILFRQEKDLDLSDIKLYADGNWSPIGNGSHHFDGGYTGVGTDGYLHSVTGLRIKKCAAIYIGLFGYLGEGSSIDGLWLKDVNIDVVLDSAYVGAIAGVSRGIVKNCICTGKVAATGESVYVGGLAGLAESNGIINSCFFNGSVLASGTNFLAGGIAGRNRGNIYACYNHGDISRGKDPQAGGITGRYMGGIAGQNSKDIYQCYNLGRVTGINEICGGIAGYSDGINESVISSVEKCYYWDGSVEKRSQTGNAVALCEMVKTEFLDKLDIDKNYFVSGLIGKCASISFTPCLAYFSEIEECRETVLYSTACASAEELSIVLVKFEKEKVKPVRLKWRTTNCPELWLDYASTEIPVSENEDCRVIEWNGEDCVFTLFGKNPYYSRQELASLTYKPPIIDSFVWNQKTMLPKGFFLKIEDTEGFLERNLVMSGRGKTYYYDTKGGGGGGGTTYDYKFSWTVRNAEKILLTVNKDNPREYEASQTEVTLNLKSVDNASLCVFDQYGYCTEQNGEKGGDNEV